MRKLQALEARTRLPILWPLPGVLQATCTSVGTRSEPNSRRGRAGMLTSHLTTRRRGLRIVLYAIAITLALW
jgi:hypothetical protein